MAVCTDLAASACRAPVRQRGCVWRHGVSRKFSSELICLAVAVGIAKSDCKGILSCAWLSG